jgi:diketogulonate reductase-like aldo/keto reductase
MAALGRPGYINLDRSSILGSERTIEMMQSQANEVIEQLLLLSKSSSFIPWLDCARSYGLSEKFVGEYLRSREIAPEDVYVSSKWGYSKFSVYSASTAAMSLLAGSIKREHSLTRNTAYVADWKIELGQGQPHEVKDHSVEVS